MQKNAQPVERSLNAYAYAYRVPRFAADLPVEFLLEGGSVSGTTENISEYGLLVRFTSPVLPGSRGTLRLSVETCVIEIEAEVTNAELFTAGLRFRFASAAEQSFVATLVKVISREVSQGKRSKRLAWTR